MFLFLFFVSGYKVKSQEDPFGTSKVVTTPLTIYTGLPEGSYYRIANDIAKISSDSVISAFNDMRFIIPEVEI